MFAPAWALGETYKFEYCKTRYFKFFWLEFEVDKGFCIEKYEDVLEEQEEREGDSNPRDNVYTK